VSITVNTLFRGKPCAGNRCRFDVPDTVESLRSPAEVRPVPPALGEGQDIYGMSNAMRRALFISFVFWKGSVPT
jgi:hypothetical protein